MKGEVHCDCMRNIVGQVREVSPGVFLRDEVELIDHAFHCPLRTADNPPPLGVFVSEKVGTISKPGK
jgi:hypothetical protein